MSEPRRYSAIVRSLIFAALGDIDAVRACIIVGHAVDRGEWLDKLAAIEKRLYEFQGEYGALKDTP